MNINNKYIKFLQIINIYQVIILNVCKSLHLITLSYLINTFLCDSNIFLGFWNFGVKYVSNKLLFA